MIIKSLRNSAAVLCVSAFILILTTANSQGGSVAFKNIFGMENASSNRNSSPGMARPGRGGLDDPANHNANDRRGKPQPGDDRGRHRGHGR